MRQALPLAFALTTGLAVLAQTQTPAGAFSQGNLAATVAITNYQANQAAPAAGPELPRFAEDTPVVIVGVVTSEPKAAEKKMQVGIGPAKTDFTLHLSGAKMYDYHGTSIDEDHFDNKMWVRAQGTVMDDPRRIKVTHLQVIGNELPSLQASAFHRPGFEQGYVVAVAGTRQIFPTTTGAAFTPGALAIVGKVSDDTGPLEATRKIQVDAAGNTWTLSVPKDTPIVDAKGEKISVHEIADGQWIRVHGWQTDDLRLRAARIQELGADEPFRGTGFYRAADPFGYVERLPGTGVQFAPVEATGVITEINARDGYFTFRDDQGVTRTVFAETMNITADGKPVGMASLRTGQRVTIQGSEIKF